MHNEFEERLTDNMFEQQKAELLDAQSAFYMLSDTIRRGSVNLQEFNKIAPSMSSLSKKRAKERKAKRKRGGPK